MYQSADCLNAGKSLWRSQNAIAKMVFGDSHVMTTWYVIPVCDSFHHSLHDTVWHVITFPESPLT